MNRKAAQLLTEKLTRELYRIAQAYGKEHPYRFEDLTYDLGVMLERDSLDRVSLKFCRPNAGHDVLVEYNYALHAGRTRFHLDDAQGLGIVPLSPPFEMSLVINRNARGGAYEHLLRLQWGDAPQYTHRGGFEHQDGNTTRRTGGRASKRIYMDGNLRRQGWVKFFLQDRQYGFITGPDGVDIFFHASNVRGFQPRKDQRVSYLLLATPRGMQAKDVRAA
jgi:cold shock CspA family protein